MVSRKWLCPSCNELRGSRHWSVQRHIKRKHNGIGEPLNVNTKLSRRQMNLASQPFQFPYPTSAWNYSSPFASVLRKNQQPSYYDNKFDAFVQQMLNWNHRIVELKMLEKLNHIDNRLLQLGNRYQNVNNVPAFFAFRNTYGLAPRPITTYCENPEMVTNKVTNTDDNSLLHDPFGLGEPEIIGYRGYVCKKCLIRNIFAIYNYEDMQSNSFLEKKHKCDPKRLQEVQREYYKSNKEEIINHLNETLPQEIQQLSNYGLKTKLT